MSKALVPNLASLQQQWFDWLYCDQPGIAQHLQASAKERLDLYRNSVFQALLQSLAQQYPRCEARVGKDYFKQLVREYSRLCPPCGRNLHSYGTAEQADTALDETPCAQQSFAHFLRSHPQSESYGLASLAALAQLEALLHLSYFAADADPWPADGFNRLDCEAQMQCQLQLAPSVFLLCSDYDLGDELTDNNCTTGYYYVVHRPEHTAICTAVDPESYLALEAIALGRQPLAKLLSKHQTLGQNLALWIGRRWLCGFTEATRLPQTTGSRKPQSPVNHRVP